YTIFVGISIIAVTVCLLLILLGFATSLSIAAVITIFVAFVVGILNFQQYRKAHAAQLVAGQHLQEATSQVSTMVAAREAAARVSGSMDALLQVENEIRSLGGVVPRTLEEARLLLEQTKDLGGLSEVQQQMKERRDEVNAARNQVNMVMEAVATLRKEHTRL